MFHINPSSLLTLTAFGPAGNAAGQVAKDLNAYKLSSDLGKGDCDLIFQDLGKGDWKKALVDTASWVTPGGQQIGKGLKFIKDETNY